MITNSKNINNILSNVVFIFLIVIVITAYNKKTLYSQHNESSDSASDADSGLSDFEGFEEENFRFKINGYVKDLFTITRTDEYSKYMFSADPDKKKNLITNLNRIRISPEFDFYDILLLHFDLDNEIITGNYLKSTEFDLFWRNEGYNDLFDLSREPYYTDKLYYRNKINSAYAKMIINDLTLTLGRQQIRFGSGKLWNPLDILNPISPTALEGPEEQGGTDAVRLEYYLSENTEMTLVVNPKRTNNKFQKTTARSTNLITRIKTTIYETDFAILGGKISKRYIAGGDISAVLFDGMLTASLVYSNPENGNTFYQASLGYEYNFKSGIYFLLEYFYNENGLNYNEKLKKIYFQSLFFGMKEEYYKELTNQFLTYNQHYTGLAIGFDFTPLIRGDLFSIYDYQGQCIFISPSLKYNILENIDLSLLGMVAHTFDDAKESDFKFFTKYGLFSASFVWYF